MQPNENITSWFDRYTTIVNHLNQLGKAIPKDEMVKRLLRSLLKTWRSIVVAKDEEKVNQIDDAEKKKIIEKKKGLALKMSSKDEEVYDNSCEDKDGK